MYHTLTLTKLWLLKNEILLLSCLGTKESMYHLPALLIVLSSAPQRAAYRAADLRILWVVNSFSKRALDIVKKLDLH